MQRSTRYVMALSWIVATALVGSFAPGVAGAGLGAASPMVPGSASARRAVCQDEATPPTDPPQNEEAEAPSREAPSEESLDLTALRPDLNPMRPLVRRYQLDRGILERFYAIEQSPTRHERMRRFHRSWLEAVLNLASESWDEEAQRSYHGLLETIYRQLADVEAAAAAAMERYELLPFAEPIIALAEARQVVEPLDAQRAARHVAAIARQVRERIDGVPTETPADAAREARGGNRWERAATDCEALRQVLQAWFNFYDAYDPQFTWWVRQPFADADQALDLYAKRLRSLAPPTGESNEAASEVEASFAGDPHRRGDRLERTWIATREPDVDDRPDLGELMSMLPNRMEPILSRYSAETGQSGRGRGRGRAPARADVSARWLEALEQVEFDSLNGAERLDYFLLQRQLAYQQQRAALRQEEIPEVLGPAGIRGRPIGRDALLIELEREWIPYAPEELIEIALRELAWCRQELIAASRELGFGDDWRQAVEHVKSLHVQPGEQPYQVRQLSDEAVAYLRQHELLTIPPLANETWRMRMMPVDQQLITPFFTGGEVVSVGFPTHDMDHEAKLQSLRGNNIPFSRATVHHELIPGHGLQQFMTARYRSYRGPFGTPFWTEGWALYWEMLLYDHGFVTTPADRVGFMVWRSHRCARIVFSLSFHLGRMTPGECVDYLVENVGFERLGAEGEVRRSFGGMYPPLYQAAYMLGGLQFRALYRELVQDGPLTPREFHDRVLREGRIPVELLRLLFLDELPPRDYRTQWRFYNLD